MSEKQFLDEFYKLISPIDKWEGEPPSLKQIFEQRLQQYEITQNQAEILLNMEKRTLNGILDKTVQRVDVINILKLGQFLGLDPGTLFKLYLNEMSPEMISELENARKKSFIVANFDVKTLAKFGFLSSKTDFDEIEKRICKYLGLKNIYEYPNKTYIPAFSKTKKSTSSLMREFWVRSAYIHFEKINNPNHYDRESLLELIPKIRPYTRNVENGLKIVSQALYNIGVTVIYQEHLPTTQVRGATFVVNGKPCITLTDLNKNYATLWFALLHEIYHVLFDFEEIQKQIFHLTGETDLFLLHEDSANDFSRDFLFSIEKTNYILPFIDTPPLVAEYAKECQIHPYIIYNFYCYDMEKTGKGAYWAKFQFARPDLKLALKGLNVNSFAKETIDETAKELNDTIFNI